MIGQEAKKIVDEFRQVFPEIKRMDALLESSIEYALMAAEERGFQEAVMMLENKDSLWTGPGPMAFDADMAADYLLQQKRKEMK